MKEHELPEASPDRTAERPERRELFETARNRASRLFKDVRSMIERLAGRSGDAAEKELVRETLLAEIHERGKRTLTYNPEDGVVGCMTVPDAITGKTPVVEAPGYINCCGVIARHADRVGVLHISPEVLPDQTGVARSAIAEHLREKDYEGMLAALLNAIGEKPPVESEQAEYRPSMTRLKPEMLTLSPEELEELARDLRLDVIGGDAELVYALRVVLSDRPGAPSLVPGLVPNFHELGTGEKTVYASPEHVFLEDKTSHDLSELSSPGGAAESDA